MSNLTVEKNVAKISNIYSEVTHAFSVEGFDAKHEDALIALLEEEYGINGTFDFSVVTAMHTRITYTTANSWEFTDSYAKEVEESINNALESICN
jgi:hypothetical protein